MREFLLGMRDGFRKGKALPWGVVVAGYFAQQFKQFRTPTI